MEAARRRAHSRAAVLQGLSERHKHSLPTSSPEQSTTTTGARQKRNVHSNIPTDAMTASSQNTATAKVAAMFQTVISDKSEKSRQYFTESLNGKTIILDNSKSIIRASSAEALVQAVRSKRPRKLSHSSIRRRKLADLTIAPNGNDMKLLHELWWDYAKSVMSRCKSGPQLQARLYASSMVGARVTIVESSMPRLINVHGIIYSESARCFFIMPDPTPTRTSALDSAVGNSGATSKKPVMALKAECSFAVVLPRTSREDQGSNSVGRSYALASNERRGAAGQVAGTVHADRGVGDGIYNYSNEQECGNICLLYGSRFMPFCKYGIQNSHS